MAQCKGTSSTRGRANFGKPCRRSAVTGSDFCTMHGGLSDTRTPDALRTRVDRQRVRCGRTKSNGEQCRNFALSGTTVCRKHGGTAPQTQKRARERLIEMLDPSMGQLHHIITKPTTSDADRIRAITVVLDRTGMGAQSEITIEPKKWEGVFAGIMVQAPPGAAVMSLGGTMAEAIRPELPVLDAEVVEDEPEPPLVQRTVVRGSAEPRRYPPR